MSIEENTLPHVVYVEITEDNCDQRLDNFLIARLKGVPKSRIYRIVRKGEVRVNKGRVDVKYRLVAGDIVRIPPIRVAERSEESYVPQGLQAALQEGILFEDEGFIIINKPAGFAVHGGTGVSSGIIEGLRLIRPEARTQSDGMKLFLIGTLYLSFDRLQSARQPKSEHCEFVGTDILGFPEVINPALQPID